MIIIQFDPGVLFKMLDFTTIVIMASIRGQAEKQNVAKRVAAKPTGLEEADDTTRM